MQLPGFKNAEGAAGNSALCEPGAAARLYGTDFYSGAGARPQATSVKNI